jgi:hypothetical protein
VGVNLPNVKIRARKGYYSNVMAPPASEPPATTPPTTTGGEESPGTGPGA